MDAVPVSPRAAGYVRPALVGAAAALVVEVVLLLSGGAFFGYEPLGDVFDAQARSFLDGRWDIPADVIKIEGFEVDGRTYTYFGPVPALLRLPVVAVTDALDGRLTRLSLLVAWAVTLAIATRLTWRVRKVVGGEEPVGRLEQAFVALFVFALGAGSSVTYLTSRPSVFHEAIAWGVASSLVAIDAVLTWSERRSLWRFALAVLLASVAINARASVGAAPSAVLGLVLLGDLVRALRRRDLSAATRATALGLVLVVPLAAYAGVTYARFGSLFTLPWDTHKVSIVIEHRRNVLEANNGSIQGPQFLPTTALHYVRPDALGIDASFPWIDFPRPATVIGDVLMDKVDPASSVPSSMPALFVLFVAGTVAAVRDPRLRRFRPLLGGAAVCLLVTLTIGFVAQRYTADAVPLLTVGGALAVPVLARSSWRRPAFAVGLVLVAASVLINAALVIQFQQHYGFLTPPNLRAALASRQLDLPAAHPPRVIRTAAALPPQVAPDRTFVVVGDCAGVYRSDGESWQPVEGTPATGHYRVRLERRAGAIELVAGIEVRWEGAELVVERGSAAARRVRVGDDDAVVLDVVADALVGFVDVRHEGEAVLSDYYFGSAAGETLAAGDGVEVLATPTPVCDALTGRSS